MKIVKVADLEALLGPDATSRLVAELTSRNAKPVKPDPTYTVIVTVAKRYAFEMRAKTEAIAAEAAKQTLAVEADDRALINTQITARARRTDGPRKKKEVAVTPPAKAKAKAKRV